MFEEWAGRSERSRSCPECGAPAQREFAAPLVRGPTVNVPVNVPSDQREVRIGEYVEAGEQLEYEHSKNEEMVGARLERPRLSQQAVRNANDILAGRRAPLEGHTPPDFEE